jgi:hypothetical protein
MTAAQISELDIDELLAFADDDFDEREPLDEEEGDYTDTDPAKLLRDGLDPDQPVDDPMHRPVTTLAE